MGFNVPYDLSRDEGYRLKVLLGMRASGYRNLPDDTPFAELQRIQAEEKKQREASLPRTRHFYAKVVGVTYSNDDGSDRQTIIGACLSFENVILEHEENNPHDPNAIMVRRQDGDQIGYLS
jgi:hypothetical protein